MLCLVNTVQVLFLHAVSIIAPLILLLTSVEVCSKSGPCLVAIFYGYGARDKTYTPISCCHCVANFKHKLPIKPVPHLSCSPLLALLWVLSCWAEYSWTFSQQWVLSVKKSEWSNHLSDLEFKYCVAFIRVYIYKCCCGATRHLQETHFNVYLTVDINILFITSYF